MVFTWVMCLLVGEFDHQKLARGVCSKSPFGLQMALYTAWLYILSYLQFVGGPLALLPLRITTVQTSLATTMHPEDLSGTHTYVSSLCHCNACVTKLLFSQVLESLPVDLLVNRHQNAFLWTCESPLWVSLSWIQLSSASVNVAMTTEQ